MADKNIHIMDSSDSATGDLKRTREPRLNALPVKRKKENEEDKCNHVKSFLDGGVNVDTINEDHNMYGVKSARLDYPSELKKYDVQFKCEVEGLRAFLDTSNSMENLIWQVISLGHTMLTALRIYQTVDQMEAYKGDDTFIFVKLKEFLLPEITRRVFLAFLSSGSQRLLAIDCGLDSTRQDMEKLQENMIEITTKLHEDKITGKRIILILPEKDARVIQMEQVDRIHYEAEGDISIDNIEKATQQRLLSKKVIRLQGRQQKTSFFELFGIDNFDDVVEQKLADYRRIMSSKTLVKLIHGEELRIGEESEGLGEIARYYIPRTIDHRVVINDRILVDPTTTDMFAIGGIDAQALEKLLINENKPKKICNCTARNHFARYIILEEGRETEHFDSFCRENSSLIIHWLQREHDKFIWMRSSGNSTNLLGYREETRSPHFPPIPLTEDQLAEYDEQRKIVILSDTAGMGKSTVLTRLAEKISVSDPCLLVIKIDLTHHTNVLAAEKRNRSFHRNDVEGAVDFLVEKLISNPEREDVLFFKTIIRVHRKVTILFDGFDEISPYYKRTVIDLLQALAKLEVKQLFVTTRPHTTRELEEKLEVFSYTLLPFSSADQIEFLTKFWEVESTAPNSDSCSLKNTDRLQKHARNVIELLANSNDPSMNEFTGVPLQTRMVAEVFPVEKFPLPKTITMIEMYSKFVDKKYNLYRREKKRTDLNIPAVKSSSNSDSKRFFMTHQRLAMNSLFDKTTVSKLSFTEGDDLDDTLEDVIKDGQRSGIVTMQRDGQFCFIHRTIAEYFVARFLTEVLRNSGCNRAVQEFFVGQLFVLPEYRVIRAFLNWLLVDNNVPLDGRSWEFDMSEHRNLERATAYHIAAKERHVGIAKFLSKNVCEPHGVPISNINCRDVNAETPLIVAVQIINNYNMVESLVDAGANVNLPASSWWTGKTALHVSVRTAGNVNVVSYLIENGADIHSRNGDSDTPLHDAAGSGHLDIVQYLAERGADINSRNCYGETPLHRAAQSGNLDLAKYLAERGADIQPPNSFGETPLHRATHSNHLDLVKYLATRGADIDYQTHARKTPLYAAAAFGYLNMVQYLAENGADVNSHTQYDETPLHGAAALGNLDMVQYLAEKGADISSENKDGETPLHCATLSGNLYLVKYLAERGADIHSQTTDGQTLLHHAACFRNLDLVKYLVKRGVNIHFQTKDGETPLHHAARFRNLDLVKYLAESGANIHSQNKASKTPLHWAADFGDLDMVHYLAERGADINSKSQNGMTPLHLAVSSGHLVMAQYLAEEGAGINSETEDGETPLHLAVQCGHLDIVHYLAEEGADINSKSHDGMTPLHEAVRSGDLVMAQYLAEEGADINSETEDGETPLHFAVENGPLDIIRYLVENGADIHSKTKDGSTPLHWAVRSDDLDIVQYLAEKEADIHPQTEDGVSPLYSAAQSGDIDLVQSIAEEEADICAHTEE